MKTKRIISLILSLLLLITVTPATFASNSNETTANLYILSKQCPEEYVNSGASLIVQQW